MHRKPAFTILTYIFLCCSMVLQVTSQETKVAANRFALVIGNGEYTELGKLKNPANDASDIADSLKSMGFEVNLLINADLVQMEDAVLRLGSKLSGSPSSIGLFYFAGHGVQSNGINYLIPSDARISGEAYLKTKSLAAQSVLDTLQNAKNCLNIIVLDACRDNPFGWARSGTRGLTIVGTQPPGSILVYATSAGSVAQDGSGRNGIFTGEFLKNLKTPGLEVSEVFKRTGAAVQEITSGVQNPAVYSQFFGSAYLNGGQGISSNTQSQPVSFGGAKPADLMVRAVEPGSDVLVDGVLKGKAPMLVQGLPSGRDLVVEVKNSTASGTLNLTLNPGELRDITISMTPLTGNLVVISNESAVRVLIDSVDKGPLGSGLFRDLPVGNHKLELIGEDLYFSKIIDVKTATATAVSAQVLPVGMITINAPDDAQIHIRGDSYNTTITGSKVLANVPAGNYILTSEGGKYLDASTTLLVKQGSQSAWEPYTTGTLLFNIEPLGTSVTLAGMSKIVGLAGASMEGIAPGTYRALLHKEGYKESEVQVSVSAGMQTTLKASLTLLKPGEIIIDKLDVNLKLFINGDEKIGVSSSNDTLLFENIPTGICLSLLFIVPGKEILGTEISLTLEEGQTVKLDIPKGRFSIPWLAEDSEVSIGNYQKLNLKHDTRYYSPLLPVGKYHVYISGKYPFQGYVDIVKGQDREIPRYRNVILTSLLEEQQNLKKSLSNKKAQKSVGYISLGTGIISLAGTVASYFLGTQAASAYADAVDTESAQAARKKVELYGTLLPTAAVLSGLGFGLSPVFLSQKASRTLQHSIDSLDKQIEALR